MSSLRASLEALPSGALEESALRPCVTRGARVGAARRGAAGPQRRGAAELDC